MTTKLHREAWMVIALAVVCIVALGILAAFPFKALSILAIIAAIFRGAGILMCFAIAGSSRFNYAQRVAAGLWGAGMGLTIQSLLFEAETPYEALAAVLASAGMATFLSTLIAREMWGRISRLGEKK